MSDGAEEKWEKRQRRLERQRRDADRLGRFVLSVVGLLVIGAVAFFYARGCTATEEPAAPPGRTVGPIPATVDDDSRMPPNALDVGAEARAKRDGVNLRREPGTDAFVVTTLDIRQRVRVLDRALPEGEEHVWYLVVTWDGTTEGPRGWVRGDMLEVSDAPESSP